MTPPTPPPERGLDKTCGLGIEIELRGEKYTMTPLCVLDYAELESRIKSRNYQIHTQHSKDLDHSVAVEVALKLLGAHVSQEQLSKALATQDGSLFLMQKSLEKRQPDFDIYKMNLNAQEIDMLVLAIFGINSVDGAPEKKEEAVVVEPPTGT